VGSAFGMDWAAVCGFHVGDEKGEDGLVRLWLRTAILKDDRRTNLHSRQNLPNPRWPSLKREKQKGRDCRLFRLTRQKLVLRAILEGRVIGLMNCAGLLITPDLYEDVALVRQSCIGMSRGSSLPYSGTHERPKGPMDILTDILFKSIIVSP